ncbi:hypothetical protein ACFCV3_41540 [Kribbella sp. NPDC056345]|uniref:hypothetical protein n=1 Tax=Kribbella sp. NPDC056345 TaxID=3345789 RepID=UPI0035DD9D2A
MIATWWTEPGLPASQNEDWFGLVDMPDGGVTILVLDGGTARTETGCSHGVAWYSRQLGASLQSELLNDPQISLVQALSASIAAVAALHADTCDLNHPGTPGAAVGIVRPIGTRTWEYAVLGDVTAVLDTPGSPTVIADTRISASARLERDEADRWPIGAPEKNAAMVAMKHTELAERNQSYWIAAADPTAAQHALTGQATDVARLAVLTDGAARACTFGLMDWEELLQLLDQDGPRKLVQAVRHAENADPAGTRWARNKKSDDATVVYAKDRPANLSNTPLGRVQLKAFLR